MSHPDQTAERRAIIHRYARMDRSGTVPKFCHPSDTEVTSSGGQRDKRRRPIIFDTIEAARDCAAELAKLDGKQLTVYECKRSRHGHAHLSDDVDHLGRP